MTEKTRKIVFVTPPYHSGIPELAGRWIPLNFVYLAGAAREAGLAAGIYDAMSKNHDYPVIEQQIREAKADYLATSAMTATINDALKTLEVAKRVNPKTVTILGGVHPSFMCREILAATEAVDYIVVGEGEATLRRLLQVLEQGGDPATVCGLAYRRGNDLVVTSPAGLVKELDALPAAWDLLDWQEYRYFLIPGSRFAAVSTSRGCKHDCVFCSQQKFWGRSWRGRDPRTVADELEYLHATYQVNVFLVADEHPTCDAQRWEELLDALIAKELPIHIIMETRADDVVRDREIFWKYERAGIIHISLGVEATDQQTLDLIRKDICVDAGREAIEIIRRHGIVSEASFLLGFPQETGASIKATLKLAQYYNPDTANFFAVTPLPYSESHDAVQPYICHRDYEKYNFMEPVIKPEQMAAGQMEAALAECYRKFYMGKIVEVMTMKDTFRRGYLLRATKLIMGSSFVMKKLHLGAAGKA